MVPQILAPKGGVPAWPVFVATTETPYEWVRDGRVVQRTGLVPGNPTLVRALLCGHPCRTSVPEGPGLPTRRCGDPPTLLPGGACAVLYGGPFPLSDFPRVRGMIEDFARGLVADDFAENDPRVRIDNWVVVRADRIPILYDGYGSRWPHRNERWWWASRGEPASGTYRMVMHERQAVSVGGIAVGTYWEATALPA